MPLSAPGNNARTPTGHRISAGNFRPLDQAPPATHLVIEITSLRIDPVELGPH